MDVVCGRGPAAGEVIAVSTAGFVAQSYQLNVSPAFGSVVVTHGPAGGQHYGLCHASETGGIEPGRHPVAWGSAEDDERDIYARQPQLAHVLRTTFSCVLVGYSGIDDRPVQRMPAQPPRVHERVWAADDTLVRVFFDDFTCLRFLLRSGVANVEDLLAAAIVHAYRAHGCDRAFLIAAGRATARLLAGDYERLTAVLELLATAAEG